MTTDFPTLSHPFMDETHEEAYALLDKLNASSDEDLPVLVSLFIDHTKSHFEHERVLMVESQFMAQQEHEGEHTRLLGAMIQFQTALARGRVAFARAFFKETLPEMLDSHIRSMDSALAALLKVKGIQFYSETSALNETSDAACSSQ